MQLLCWVRRPPASHAAQLHWLTWIGLSNILGGQLKIQRPDCALQNLYSAYWSCSALWLWNINIYRFNQFRSSRWSLYNIPPSAKKGLAAGNAPLFKYAAFFVSSYTLPQFNEQLISIANSQPRFSHAPCTAGFICCTYRKSSNWYSCSYRFYTYYIWVACIVIIISHNNLGYSHATVLHELGVDDKTIQRWKGHASQATTANICIKNSQTMTDKAEAILSEFASSNTWCFISILW